MPASPSSRNNDSSAAKSIPTPALSRIQRRRPPRNPVSRPLAWLSVITLIVTGGSAFLGWQPVFDWTARPMLLACALAVIAYTAQALRLGWIATIGGVGQIYHYRRADEPVLYWLLVALYLSMAIPTAIYLARELI